MRILWLPILALLFTANEGAAIAQVARRTLFILNDIRREQWCAYKDESRWRDTAVTLGARHNAEVDFVNRTPQTVVITLNADSGDWAVEDTYSLTPSESPRRLRRRILHEAGGFIEESVFAIENDRARLERRETKSAYSGQLMQSQRESQYYFFPDFAIITRMRDFPFHSILTGEHPEVWTEDRVCVKSNE